MKIRKPTEEEFEIFKDWMRQQRTEERTCRPVQDGKVVHGSHKPETLIFFLEEHEEPIGKFSYFDYNSRNRSCEFGYFINPKFQGKGLGEKMTKECVNYLFSNEELNLNKLYCQTGEFNKPSIKILENLGLNKDGVLREHHELDGKLWSDFVYSILKSEWIK